MVLNALPLGSAFFVQYDDSRRVASFGKIVFSIFIWFIRLGQKNDILVIKMMFQMEFFCYSQENNAINI